MAIDEKKIILHRGLFPGQEFPNSMEIFTHITPGATIEFDVFQLRDGALAVIHNKDFGISTEEVELMDAADVTRLQIRGRVSGATVGPVPLLPTFVEKAAEKKLSLWCEIKGSAGATAARAARATVQYFSTAAYPYPVYLLSFSLEALEAAREEASHAGIALPLILSWTSGYEWAEQQAITRSAFQRAQRLCGPDLQGDAWAHAAVAVARDLGCAIVSLGYDGYVCAAAIREAHELGLVVVAPIARSRSEADYYFSQGSDLVTLEEL